MPNLTIILSVPIVCLASLFHIEKPNLAIDDLDSALPTVIYVDTSANLGGNGTSWATAHKYLQDGLANARAHASNLDKYEIWVADGIYYPDDDEAGNYQKSNRNESFEMINYVDILGGFDGSETDKSDRNWVDNITILSGDIDQNGVETDFSYNIIRNDFNSLIPLDSKPLLSGFTLMDTYNNNKSNAFGGAIYNSSSNARFEYCIFKDNYAGHRGGAIYNFRSNITIINCLYFDNESTNGHSIYSVQSDPKVTNCTFSSNGNGTGTNIENENNSDINITNSILWNNDTEIMDDVTSSAFVENSIVEGGFSGNNIMTSDPNFIDIYTNNYRLKYDSPAIDLGDNNDNNTSNDLDNNDRISNDSIDAGAYEFRICRIHVRSGASLGGDGRSWNTSFKYMQDALAVAEDSLPNYDQVQIWVTIGNYYPDEDEKGNVTADDRSENFYLIKDVAIYGGFLNNQTLEERNLTNHLSTLSGDIDQNDNQNDSTSNAYNVIYSSGSVDSSAILDRFMIQSGYADGFSSERHGAGIHLNYSSPSISNCVIQNNKAIHSGGGMYLTASEPILSNVIFTGNTCQINGGGLHCSNSSISLKNCVFQHNKSENSGGAIYAGATNSQSNIKVSNTLMHNNLASGTGGALRISTNSSIDLKNSTIVDNTANFHAGISLATQLSNTINNSIYWNNKTFDGAHSVLTGDNLNGNNSLIQNGLVGGQNIIDENPLFVDTLNDDFRLTPCSAAINFGDSTLNTSPYDLDGNMRILDSQIDLGAYEYTFQARPIIYVDSSANGSNNGTSWNNAYNFLQDALNNTINNSCTEIWVAQGTYYPDEGDGYNDNLRDSSFIMHNDTEIYGGFVGIETNRSQRDWELNKTILSGDIDKNDDLGDSTNNAYHVIYNYYLGGNQLKSSAVLDGFVISGGRATGSSGQDQNGGGIYNFGGSPFIRNCILTDNYALDDGGAAYIQSGNINFTNCVFKDNKSNNEGGALTMRSKITVDQCLFENNISLTKGGAIQPYDSHNFLISRTKFINNRAQFGGALSFFNSEGALINCLFVDNKDLVGGAIRVELSSSCNIYSSTFFGNSAGISQYNSDTSNIYNSILWDASDQINETGTGKVNVFKCYIKDGITSANQFNEYPEFMDTTNRNLSLKSCSSAIDRGDESYAYTSTDLDGNNRLVDADKPFITDTLDIGAYEYQGTYTATCCCCPQHLSLTGMISSGTYTASSSITCNGTIAAGANVTLSAPDSIVLDEDFNVIATGLLQVDNVGCN